MQPARPRCRRKKGFAATVGCCILLSFFLHRPSFASSISVNRPTGMPESVLYLRGDKLANIDNDESHESPNGTVKNLSDRLIDPKS